MLAMATVVVLSMPAEASAQERQGFWFGIGGGYGWAGVSCDDCDDSDREGSGVGYLKGGWTLNRRVLLGVEVGLWTKSDTSESFELAMNLYHVSGTITFYPQADNGFFLKGGAGVAFVDVDVSGSGSSMTVDLGQGPGFLVGVGFDIPVARRVAVTPAVNYWYGRPGDLKVMGETFAGSWRQNVIDLTIGITFP